jgi:hypothetical protein
MRFISRASHSTRPILLATLLMASIAFPVAANAQPAWVGKFTLPYEVHWNHAVLPAGDYTISVDSKSSPALIRATNGSRSIYTNVPTVATSERGPASLLITGSGGQHTVRSMNSPLLDVSLVFQAIPKSEREALAKTGELESVPVMVTKK